jgi:hypothetical protein
VLLNNDGDWVVEEAVKAPRCIPGLPGPVRYHGIDGWDERGEPLPKDSNEYQQWIGEFWVPWRPLAASFTSFLPASTLPPRGENRRDMAREQNKADQISPVESRYEVVALRGGQV